MDSISRRNLLKGSAAVVCNSERAQCVPPAGGSKTGYKKCDRRSR
jgi:hypothetical protein